MASQNYLTDVGTYPSASSSYGTFDQGGNVEEWNEAPFLFRGHYSRGRRGGNWHNIYSLLRASARNFGDPFDQDDYIGFRVASVVPEPSTLLLGTLACVGLLRARRVRC